MPKSRWRLQDAQAKFSELVESALRGEPQHVTRRGREAVVVLSEASYRALRAGAQAEDPGFVAHLLAIPKDEIAPATPAKRGRLAHRDVNL